MTDLEKAVKKAEKKVSVLMKSAKWQKAVKKSDRQVNKTIETLRQNSKVDPRLLEEPATL